MATVQLPMGRIPWWLVVVMGAISSVLGVVLLAWPKKTTLVLVVILAIWLLVIGTLRFLFALVDSSTPDRGLTALVSVVAVLLGLLVIREPYRSIAILVVAVGLYWVVAGFMDGFEAVARADAENRWLRLTLAVLTVAAGLTVLIWPEISALTFAIIAGVYLLVGGVTQIALGFRLRPG